MKRISRTTLFKSIHLALCLAAALPLASRASDVTPAVSTPTTTGDATTDSTKKVQNLDAVKVTGAAVTVDQIAPTQIFISALARVRKPGHQFSISITGN
jgi:iron complex outermembrane receptor protein